MTDEELRRADLFYATDELITRLLETFNSNGQFGEMKTESEHRQGRVKAQDDSL